MKYIKLLLATAVIALAGASAISAQRIDSVDVDHYNLQVNITKAHFSAKQITGKATLNCRSLFNNMNHFTLDLQKLSINSITVNGLLAAYSQTDSTFNCISVQTFNRNDSLRIVIEYSGAPVTDARWGGFFFTGDYAFNMGVGMASNPPVFGRCWFPCVDNFTDRATYTFQITTDTGYMAVCSGIQQPAQNNGDGTITWNWKLNQTIPTYIANVAVSKYVLLNHNFQSISGKSIPVTLAVNIADTGKARVSFQRLDNALQCFESRFGPYRFDRVGYVGVPFNSGAMEHACNISYPIYAIDGTQNFETLFAHELSHHWFGNLATTSTAADMWLNEGWASYCEDLFLECVYGKDAYNQKINDDLFEVLRWAHVRDGAYLPVAGVPLAQTYGTHVYTKGSLIAHSLRVIINNDSAFFQTLRTYFDTYAFKETSTLQFQQHFEKTFGSGITKFFDCYVTEKGHIDLQPYDLYEIGSDVRYYGMRFKLMSRYKTHTPDTIILYGRDVVQWNHGYPMVLFHDSAKDDYFSGRTEPNLEPIIEKYGVGDNTGTMLGTTSVNMWLKGTTIHNLNNALISITPKQNPDSQYVHAEHHFTGPWQAPDKYPKGIRVSSERFWRVVAEFNNNFKASAFLNYDGSAPATKNAGYLDNELITGTEDSLVLLYRKTPRDAFVVVVDVTLQTGSSKTDKTGRFWVNNLVPGEYVLGYRDILAGITTPEILTKELRLYPNPADLNITLELPNNHSNGKIMIFNQLGATVIDQKVARKESVVHFNISTLPAGNYYLIFEDENGKIKKTFVVK